MKQKKELVALVLEMISSFEQLVRSIVEAAARAMRGRGGWY